jgi:hypothetical protein
MDETLELGELINMFRVVKEEKAQHEKEIKRLAERYDILEQEIIKRLSDAKLEKVAHGGMTVTPERKTFPHLEDWAQASDWMLENKAIYLLEKRIAVTSYRELLEMGRSIPGVVPYVKTKLATRTT